VRQWERFVFGAFERLRTIKMMYRTPQGLRSFSRLFSVLLPSFFSPYFAQVARDVNSLGVGIVFSIITSLALTALFETISQLEDPFVQLSILDGVYVTDDLGDDCRPHLFVLRRRFFPNASQYEEE